MSQQNNETYKMSTGMTGIVSLVKILQHFGIKFSEQEFVNAHKDKADADMK